MEADICLVGQESDLDNNPADGHLGLNGRFKGVRGYCARVWGNEKLGGNGRV